MKRYSEMSYDLNFWRQKPNRKTLPQKIYDDLCEGKIVRELESLPIEDIIGRILETFPESERFYFGETLSELNWQSEAEGTFQVTWSPQHFRVDCYGVSEDKMNRLIEIAYEFTCSFYDPQVAMLHNAIAR